jgi:8-oxo-dGTP diphosphatase
MKLATLCYILQDDRILMLHRIKKENDIHAGKWNGLGGKLDPPETPEECVMREVLEESGLTVPAPHLQGLITFPMFDGEDDWYCYVYTATEFSGELIDSPEGELEWIPNSEVLDLNLWEGDRLFLQWILDGRFFSAKFVYVDGALTEHSVVFHDHAPERSRV